jgi:hypothetical protein
MGFGNRASSCISSGAYVLLMAISGVANFRAGSLARIVGIRK